MAALPTWRRQAEVDQPGHAIVSQHDVRGLDVAVQETAGVHRFQALGRLLDPPRRGPGRHGTLRDPPREIPARDVFHHQDQLIANPLDPEALRDEAAADPHEGLAVLEGPHQLEAAFRGVVALDHDQPAQVGVAGQEGRALAPAAEPVHNDVLADPQRR